MDEANTFSDKTIPVLRGKDAKRFLDNMKKIERKRARKHINPLLQKLLDEITPAEMEAMKIRMLEEVKKRFEEAAEEYGDVKILYDSYKKLTKQKKWSEEFLEGYLSCISDLIYTKKLM